MKLFYSNDFQGHWPVGTSAIVWATNAEEAHAKLSDELESRGLPTDSFTVQEFPRQCAPLILQDGNY